jgi:tRNA(fMet)-specific endonuclease VapC
MSRVGSVLLDTSIIVDFLRGDERLLPHFAAAATTYVPLVVLGELYFGAQRALRREESLAKIRDFLRTATLLLPDDSTAEQYGEVKAELARIGKPIPENDVWIAAMARQHDLSLATRDTHFAVVPRLTTLAW